MLEEVIGNDNEVTQVRLKNTIEENKKQVLNVSGLFINYNNKSINIESIQNLVASHYKLSLEEMLSPRRSRSLARPRQIAMYLAKQYTTNSLPDIGRKFSNRDHTTVIHAVKKIDELIKKDNEIKQNVTEIKKKLI